MRPSMSSLNESPPPPPPPVLPPSSLQFSSKWNNRAVRENRLLSDLWLMSAATFRRLGKIEQAKGAIQEAEVKDEGNPAVWVQVSKEICNLRRIMLTSFLILARALLYRIRPHPRRHRVIPQGFIHLNRRYSFHYSSFANLSLS